MTADSYHGFKMIGVGRLVAEFLTSGWMPLALALFSYRRLAEGKTYSERNSNGRWV